MLGPLAPNLHFQLGASKELSDPHALYYIYPHTFSS